MLKHCEGCGKEFNAKKSKVRFCAYECGKVNSVSIQKERGLVNFKKSFHEKHGYQFKYVFGYDGCDSKVEIRCIPCGNILIRNAQIARKNKKIVCEYCIKIDKKSKSEAIIKEKQNRSEKKRAESLVALRRKLLSAMKICDNCDRTFLRTHRNQKRCGDECSKNYENRMNENRRRHKLRENGEVDRSITLMKLRKRDRDICNLCGTKVNVKCHSNDENYPSIDHVVPVSKGGTHTWGNVQLAHRGCNSIKRDSDWASLHPLPIAEKAL